MKEPKILTYFQIGGVHVQAIKLTSTDIALAAVTPRRALIAALGTVFWKDGDGIRRWAHRGRRLLQNGRLSYLAVAWLCLGHLRFTNKDREQSYAFGFAGQGWMGTAGA